MQWVVVKCGEKVSHVSLIYPPAPVLLNKNTFVKLGSGCRRAESSLKVCLEMSPTTWNQIEKERQKEKDSRKPKHRYYLTEEIVCHDNKVSIVFEAIGWLRAKAKP
jgi:hypothetical protein